MLLIPGRPALSPFRIDQLLTSLRAHLPGLRDVAVDHLHLAELERPLDAAGRARLERLLAYGPELPPSSLGGRRVIVVPRFGTRSPWSSKACVASRRTMIRVPS